MELNKIYNENCLETMGKMPDNFVDLVVTSPPYDDMDEDFNPIPAKGLRDYNGYTWDFKGIAAELYRVLKPGGVVVWVVNDPTVNGSESLASSFQKIYFRRMGFYLHDTMIYKGTNALPDPTRYYQCVEFMLVLSKGKLKFVRFIEDRKNRFTERWGGGRVIREKDGSQSPRGKYEGKEYGRRFNVWEYNTGFGHSSEDELAFKHPATFPEQLAADHIYSWSNEGDLVYDPFMGSGTTAKMAHLQNRKWIGSEISAEYVALAEKRLQPYLLQGSLFNSYSCV